MIGSRRAAAITATLVGALLIAGAPTFAFGEGDATHQAKANSTVTTSGQVTAQKAKDDNDKGDNKKDADNKKASDNNKPAESNKKASDNNKKASDSGKKGSDDRQAEAKKPSSDPKPADKNSNKKNDDARKSDSPKKGDDGKKASDSGRKAHNNKAKDTDDRDRKRADDEKRSNDPHKNDWKNTKHGDKWNRDWDHHRDRNHRHHDWDTHRHYYRYGYYGPGWYDDCGYYSPGWDGYSNDYYYYGPDACGYEYGQPRSSYLVDMSWDQVGPRPGPDGAVGTANIDIDVPSGTVCFRLAYDGIDQAIGAQIHPGLPGQNGPNAVLLHVGANGDDGCVGADPRLLSQIQDDPAAFYLEIDDANGPAMRGQLVTPDYQNVY
jgi:hypothetical protein